MPRLRPVLTATAVLVLAAALAGCGSDSSSDSTNEKSPSTSSTSSSSSTTSANPLASAPAPADHFDDTISFVQLPDGGGLVLVGPNGHSLYLFDRDQGTTSACTGPCAQAWPPLKADGPVTVAPGLDAAKATTVADGQVAYNGHLLYYFAADQVPGNTNGISVAGWHVVSPAGTPMASR